MEPKNRSGISYWASAWLMGLVGLLTAALWPQAWAQTPLVERGEGSARGWWADQATLEARMNFERAMARLETDAWARERGRFLRSLRSSDDLVLKSLGEDLDDLDMATAPEVPPSVVESIVDWAVGRRMPSEYEVRQMVQERLNGTSAFVSMRMNGLNLAVGIPISSQVSLNGAVLADFVMAAPIFSDRGLFTTDIYRYFNNLGYSLGLDVRTGSGEVVFGRMIVRGNEVNPTGLTPSAAAEPLFLGVMVGTVFDRWQPVPISEAR